MHFSIIFAVLISAFSRCAAEAEQAGKCIPNDEFVLLYRNCYMGVTGAKELEISGFRKAAMDDEITKKIALCVLMQYGVVDENNTIFDAEKAEKAALSITSDETIKKKLSVGVRDCIRIHAQDSNEAKVDCIHMITIAACSL